MGDWEPACKLYCVCGHGFQSRYREIVRLGLKRWVAEEPCKKCGLDFRIVGTEHTKNRRPMTG